MAGARNTNRRLQRILLRGLVFPAAAAGAIILGASAASAEDGTLSGSLQETTSAVQSTVEDTGGAAAETVESQPEPADAVATGGSTVEAQQSVTEETSTNETTLQQTQDAVAETAPAAARDATDAAVAEASPAQLNTDTGDQLASETTSPVTAVPQDTSRATQPLAESSDLVQPSPAPRDELIEPVAKVIDQQAEVVQNTTGEAAEQTRQVSEVADTAVAPVANLADDVGDQADDTVTRSTETITEAVSGVADLDAESTPIFDALSEELSQPITETTPLFDTVTRDLTDAVTGGTTGDLLTPVTETTTGLTGGITNSLLTPVTETTTGLTQDLSGGLTSSLLTPATGTTAGLTSGLTSSLLTPLGETTHDLTGGLTSSLLPPVTETTTGLTRDLTRVPTSSLLPPVTQTTHDLTGVALAPASETIWLATAEPAGSSIVCTSDSAGAGISTSAACSESAEGLATVNMRDWLAVLPLATSYPFPWAPDAISTWDALAQSGALTVPDSAAPAAAGTAPMGQPFGPLGGIVEGLSSAGGSGVPGPSGSILLLFAAMLGSAVILRNGGLSQLASGTATILSGRAALVHDRPG